MGIFIICIWYPAIIPGPFSPLTNASACIVVADDPVLWTYETATCLTGVNFSNYQFISIYERLHSCNARVDGESHKSQVKFK
jgi:hypothetical protein